MFDPFDPEPERAARNQSLCRAVNDQIQGLSALLVGLDAVEYLCECADLGCPERVAVPHAEYRRVRRHSAEFIVAPGHEQPHFEEVVERGHRFVVVRKLEVGARVGAELVSLQ